MFSYLSSRDKKLMRKLNGWRPPHWVRIWMVLASRLGDGWLWWGIGIAIMIFGGPLRWVALAATLASAAIAIAFFSQIKKLFNRTRPCEIAEHCWATLLPPDQFSFPSGHTMTAFSIAVPLSLFYPAIEPALLFCAFSIAISRIMLGLHYLTDVIVGAALGSVIGYAIYSIAAASYVRLRIL